MRKIELNKAYLIDDDEPVQRNIRSCYTIKNEEFVNDALEIIKVKLTNISLSSYKKDFSKKPLFNVDYFLDNFNKNAVFKVVDTTKECNSNSDYDIQTWNYYKDQNVSFIECSIKFYI